MNAIPGGYNGKILRVNLSTSDIKVEKLDAQFCREYLGGAGFIAYYLWKEMNHHDHPLHPENKLIFALGPISGLMFPGSSRVCIGAKSPLTGTIAKSEAGGFWPAELKRTGYDALIIEGKAKNPCYLYVSDVEVDIKDANCIWGKETRETEAAIRSELEDNLVHVALIGPAGENQVLYACIMNGLYDAAGRGGLGAVMGSKNLKAIAVRGHQLPAVADNSRLKEIRFDVIKNPPPHPFTKNVGTGGWEMETFESLGNLPVRNFRDGLFPEVKHIHGGIMANTISVGMEGCFACPLRCKKKIKIDNPYQVDPVYGGPEYESIASLGSDCGIGDIHAIVKGNERCNALGLDTISTGSTIAFAMECFEKGLLRLKDTGGINIEFGNPDVMLKCIELIAHRQGVGDILAEGTARISRKIRKGSSDFAMNVKGLESGMHDPRFSLGYGLVYMLAPTGADHCANEDFNLNNEEGVKQLSSFGICEIAPPGIPSLDRMKFFRFGHFKTIIDDSLVMCAYTSSLDLQVKILRAVTGWDINLSDLFVISERIATVFRLFNVREGFSPSDDELPLRFFQHKTDGILATKQLVIKEEMEKAKLQYYHLMGWDEGGDPTKAKLDELGLK